MSKKRKGGLRGGLKGRLLWKLEGVRGACGGRGTGLKEVMRGGLKGGASRHRARSKTWDALFFQ